MPMLTGRIERLRHPSSIVQSRSGSQGNKTSGLTRKWRFLVSPLEGSLEVASFESEFVRHNLSPVQTQRYSESSSGRNSSCPSPWLPSPNISEICF